jgi:hypothetical protein
MLKLCLFNSIQFTLLDISQDAGWLAGWLASKVTLFSKGSILTDKFAHSLS